jgi:hypothetical protein
MSSIKATDVIPSFHRGDERMINASNRLYQKATALTRRGAAFDLKELNTALRPACALLALGEWDSTCASVPWLLLTDIPTRG